LAMSLVTDRSCWRLSEGGCQGSEDQFGLSPLCASGNTRQRWDKEGLMLSEQSIILDVTFE